MPDTRPDTRLTRRTIAGTLSAPLLSGFQSSQTRPNVLLLHCHDLGQHLHCYNVDSVQSPNLDRLASEGVLFERSFCSAPQCSPSRASIFTGRYPHSNGVMGLTHANFAWELNPAERHLGQILGSSGYGTAGVGVLHETHSGPQRCGLGDYAAATSAQQMADAVISRLADFSKDPSKPFYLQAGCIEPHRLARRDRTADQDFLGDRLQPDTKLGITVPPYLRSTEGTRAELGELQGAIRHMDAQVGRVLESLRSLGLERNTLVIFTTDHGIAMPRSKCSLYEPGLSTAFILRYPAREGWHGGVRHRQMVSNVDYLPTILDLVGVPVPSDVQGRSLRPLLEGRPYTERDSIFGEMTYHDYYDPRRSVRSQTHKLIVNFSAAPAFMDPSQSWRPRSDTVVPANRAMSYHPPFELYNLKDDPWEQQDIANDASSRLVLEDLRSRLVSHMQTT
ncbi:MAG: sulfatase, partial [Bryobacteraceae bacterium]|nr:sulfatase [Bryobacteraceae bacterium]